jgi:hypothetical protein
LPKKQQAEAVVAPVVAVEVNQVAHQLVDGAICQQFPLFLKSTFPSAPAPSLSCQDWALV